MRVVSILKKISVDRKALAEKGTFGKDEAMKLSEEGDHRQTRQTENPIRTPHAQAITGGQLLRPVRENTAR